MHLSSTFLARALPHAQLLVKQASQIHRVGDDVVWVGKDEEIPVSFDSRDLQDGALFVALKGNTVDGHSFIKNVLEQGAVALLISDLKALDAIDVSLWQKNLVIIVEDTHEAMITLARAWRAQLSMPIVAITGSVGKSTTKEMVRSILQAAHVSSLVSSKNQNTVLGICATILNIKTDHKVAVCEVGVSLQGEMEQRIEILRPTMAVITNVGHAHVQGLGGLTGVVHEKRQIFKYFEPYYVGIINGDQPLLTGAYYNHPIAKFGCKTSNQVQARKIVTQISVDGLLNLQFTLKWYGKKSTVTLRCGHQGYVTNALAASTVAYFLNIPFAQVVAGLEKYEGFEGRFQLHQLKTGKGSLISDCYNANPESMRAAIDAFGKMTGVGKKIAVIGDMLELGDKEIFWNRQVGRMLAKAGGIDEVILVGPLAAAARNTVSSKTKVTVVPTWQEAVEPLARLVKDNAFVLVKGSRGVGLKNLVQVFI